MSLSPFKAHRAYQFLVPPGPAAGVHSSHLSAQINTKALAGGLAATSGGQSALQLMLRGEISDLAALREGLDAERGAW